MPCGILAKEQQDSATTKRFLREASSVFFCNLRSIVSMFHRNVARLTVFVVWLTLGSWEEGHVSLTAVTGISATGGKCHGTSFSFSDVTSASCGFWVNYVLCHQQKFVWVSNHLSVDVFSTLFCGACAEVQRSYVVAIPFCMILFFTATIVIH